MTVPGQFMTIKFLQSVLKPIFCQIAYWNRYSFL